MYRRRPLGSKELQTKNPNVLAPVIGRYGGASSDLSLFLDLVAREMARKHTASYNICFSEAKALFRQKLTRKWGHAISRGWATLLLDRLRDFVSVPSSAGRNSSFELHSLSTEECAALDHYHHFQGHSEQGHSKATRACAPD